MPVVLTIAGSDPSGGAGLQADLRTFAALDVLGLSVVTALTVQNSRGVRSVHVVSPELVAAQLDAVLEDTRPDAVKIGMLGGAAQVHAVADALRRFHPRNVVLDPVLASTGGVPLLDEDGRQALLTELFPLCHLVTPNLEEAGALTGLQIVDLKAARLAGEQLRRSGPGAVLVKGGHLPGEPADTLLDDQDRCLVLPGSRVPTPHDHGTGCFLSSAIAAHLAKGLPLDEAVRQSKDLLTRALMTPAMVGQGRGYPDAFAALRVDANPSFTPLAARSAKLSGLYFVTDPHLAPHRTALVQVQAALTGGARVVQLRHKGLPTPQLIALARELQHAARQAGAAFIVNDRVDVALAANADGVHLGPDDMRPDEARRLLGPDKLIGVSTGTLAEARAAAPVVSYFGVGAIFGTQTKGDAGDAVGTDRIREIKAAFPHIPLVAIGGINQANIAAVARAGADAAAVVSAVMTAPDMVEATRELVRLFSEARGDGHPADRDHGPRGEAP